MYLSNQEICDIIAEHLRRTKGINVTSITWDTYVYKDNVYECLVHGFKGATIHL